MTKETFEGDLSEQRLLVHVLGDIYLHRLKGLLLLEAPGLPALELHIGSESASSPKGSPEAEVRRTAAIGLGHYALMDGGSPGEQAVPLIKLVLAAARSIPAIETVRSALGDLDSAPAITPAGSKGLAGGSRFSAQEEYVLTRFDGAVSIRQLVQISPAGDEETLRTILGLVAAGLLGTDVTELRAATLPPSSLSAPEVAAAAPSAPLKEDPMAKLQGFLQKTRVSDSAPAGAQADRPRPSTRRAATRPKPEPRRRVAPQATAKASPAAEAKELTGDGMDRVSLLARLRTSEAQSYYELLEVETGASEDHIRHSYYSLARRFHPDRFHTPDLLDLQHAMEIMFGRINQAFRTLMNKERRMEYDHELQIGNKDQAKVQKKAAQELSRQNFRRGQQLLASGQMVKALSFFENAVRADQTCAEYYETLGMLQSLNPRLKTEAETTLKEAIKLAPSRATGYLRLGLHYFKTKQPRKATAALQKALTWDPTDAMARMALGKVRAGSEGAVKDGTWLIKKLLAHPETEED